MCSARSMYCEYSQYLEVPYCGYACTPSISCFDTSGTYFSVLSGFRTAHTLCYLSIWAFSILAICAVLALFWPPVLQYAQYSHYELFSSIFLRNLYFTVSAKKCIFCGNIIMCVLDLTQPFIKYSVATLTSRSFFVVAFALQALN